MKELTDAFNGVIAERDALQKRITELEASNTDLRTALERAVTVINFYSDPQTYFAMSIIADRPCGEFVTDYEELSGELGHPDGSPWQKPGKRARVSLTDLRAVLEANRGKG